MRKVPMWPLPPTTTILMILPSLVTRRRGSGAVTTAQSQTGGTDQSSQHLQAWTARQVTLGVLTAADVAPEAGACRLRYARSCRKSRASQCTRATAMSSSVVDV